MVGAAVFTVTVIGIVTAIIMDNGKEI